jgi:hypothetical protein
VTSTTAATFVIERKAALVRGNGLELFSAEHIGGHFVFTSALKSEEIFVIVYINNVKPHYVTAAGYKKKKVYKTSNYPYS